VRKVLVVEDDPDIVELLGHYLRREQFQVDAVSDGQTALERVRSQRYDLVLLDLQLPQLEGLAVCRELRGDSRTRELPIIMITARGDETDRIVGLEMGVDIPVATMWMVPPWPRL
jgi:DNA-binding response OmpR family regulator